MLTVENVNKHFPESEETVKRHMNRQQQGVRFTKPKDFEELSASSEIEKKKRDVYLKVVDLWCPRWADVSGQYLNSLFRRFATSFGRDPSVSSLTIPTIIHNLINQSINRPIGIQSSQVPTGLGQYHHS